MKTLIYAVLLTLGSLFAGTSATAQSATPPSHVKITFIQMGEMKSAVTYIYHKENPAKRFYINLLGCDVRWATGETWVILSANDTHLLIRKSVLETALRAVGDWDRTLQALVQQKQVCQFRAAPFA